MAPPRVAVLGAGVSGQAAARLLDARGFEVTVFDQKAKSLPQGVPGGFALVQNPTELVERIVGWGPETMVISPGVSPTSTVFAGVQESGVEVIGEVELAWRSARDPNWLCVTGTNGKTTTVKMLASILQAAGEDVVAAGNVGFAVTENRALDSSVLPVELSSAQLATTYSMAPTASICLNVDVDHVDWHGSKEAYWEAKASVYNNTQVARLYFADDEVVKGFAEEATGAGRSALVPLTFGSVREGEIGIVDGVLINGFTHASNNPGSDPAAPDLTEPDRNAPNGFPSVDLMDVPLLRAGLKKGGDSVLVRDALAAAGLAIAAGVSPRHVNEGLKTFHPEPHRLAFVGEKDAVTFINDSKATNMHAARAALTSFDPRKLVWIVGGDTKGQDLSALIEEFGPKVRGAVVIGADQVELLDTFSRLAPSAPVTPVVGKGDPSGWMGKVVRASKDLALPGDTVLLAPACASWDQFEGYEHRGRLFTEAVAALDESE